mmetsp:Transcript_70433/g.161619  ORF Transcript_70433/g.161619 Transcript_70433/m.161619 type:complete len:206 (-) Transcript_70433:427-1044(-)
MPTFNHRATYSLPRISGVTRSQRPTSYPVDPCGTDPAPRPLPRGIASGSPCNSAAISLADSSRSGRSMYVCGCAAAIVSARKVSLAGAKLLMRNPGSNTLDATRRSSLFAPPPSRGPAAILHRARPSSATASPPTAPAAAKSCSNGCRTPATTHFSTTATPWLLNKLPQHRANDRAEKKTPHGSSSRCASTARSTGTTSTSGSMP